jgi:hypothetical protein
MALPVRTGAARLFYSVRDLAHPPEEPTTAVNFRAAAFI